MFRSHSIVILPFELTLFRAPLVSLSSGCASSIGHWQTPIRRSRTILAAETTYIAVRSSFPSKPTLPHRRSRGGRKSAGPQTPLANPLAQAIADAWKRESAESQDKWRRLDASVKTRYNTPRRPDTKPKM
ncbi:hypothetical protein DFP72DRAFT_524833 [Ephemerocybe angulata]|uniref:HMG box domain-containing protein n=1 Tax=Ephemerocybe angulata TaxID=980116 RepID=A0A8H6IG00_9AGAR|nr:hypothetical protein DFP72DRAFT_524833 [Tulosesus angulatus]